MRVDDLRVGDRITLPDGHRYAGDEVTVNTISRGAVTTVVRVDWPDVRHFAVQLPNDLDIEVVAPARSARARAEFLFFLCLIPLIGVAGAGFAVYTVALLQGATA